MAVKSWDRLKKEGEKAYHAFTFYRDLSADETSLINAEMLYRNYYNKDTSTLRRSKQPSKTITTWSTRFAWVKRRKAYWTDLEKKARVKGEKIRIKEIAEAKKSMRQTARLSQSVSEIVAGILNIELRKVLKEANTKNNNLEIKDLVGLAGSMQKSGKNALDTWQVLEPDDFAPKQKVELAWAEKLALDNEVDPQKFLDDMDVLLLMNLEDDEDS